MSCWYYGPEYFNRLAEVIRRSYGLPPPCDLESAINVFFSITVL